MKESPQPARLPLIIIVVALGLAGTFRAEPRPSLATAFNRPAVAPTVRGAEVILSGGKLQSVEGQTQSSDGVGGARSSAAQSGAAFISEIIDAPLPFSHIAIRYSAVVPAGANIGWEVRGSRDRQSWTKWYRMEEEDDLRFSPANEVPLRLFGLNEDGTGDLYRFAQVRATFDQTNSAGSPTISKVALVFIDPTPGPTTAEAARASGISSLGASPLTINKPPIISRTAWGSPDGQGSPNWAPEYRTVTHAIIHHTVTANQAVDWAAEVRAVWYYHTYIVDNGGWGDIGYNYLIDPNGYIYEGRAGGDDVAAGHALQYNYGSLGLAFLGTYSNSYPSTAAQNSGVDLLTWKADQRGIDPLKTDAYLVDRYLPTFLGHRDALNTTCPGNYAYSIIPQLRSTAWNRIASQGAAAQVVSAAFEPVTVASGNLLKITAVVRNTGITSVQTQGPSPGFVYNEGDQYAAVESEKFGRFRIAVDYDGRTQSLDHPYRWGFGRELAPGETATVVGFIRLTGLRTANYWVGLVQEGITWAADGVGRTSVRVVSSDALAPTSSVMPLPRFVNTPTFLVRWNGSDEVGGSGLSYFDVEYRDGPNGVWQPWIQRTNETQATFVGASGRTYYFRSWAVDNTGNDERLRATKTNGDTLTTVDTDPPTVSVNVPSSTDKTWLVVNWSAADVLSGIAPSFDVSYSVNGSTWTPWLSGVGGSSALFVDGAPGQKYFFRVTARDNAGNQASAIGGPVQLGYDSSGIWKTRLPLIGKNTR